MEFADNPLIRRTLAPQRGKDQHAKPRAWLWNALLQFRERAAFLANEIHRDLPDFTDHGPTHLDALWEMADLIAGPEYPINPLEAFVLGGVFLIHDLGLGLAAWPGGVEEVRKGAGWGDALSTLLRKRLDRVPTPEELASPPADIERAAIQERLRMLHAEQAERLALASFPANPKKGETVFYLIEDADLRQQLGSLLGKIAHSHWWPVSRLASEFGTIRGALPTCPADWTIDPLKISVLLRTADASHLDARRAPGFLLAIRRAKGFSRDHWTFQNHLLKPHAKDDRLVYTANRPFQSKEADAWWLCEEMLRIVDRELYHVDALLADRGNPRRLQLRGVAGVERLIYSKRHTNAPRVEYADAVEEALCFGWIDSIVRTIDGDRYAQKFTPRKAKSKWSALNRERFARMVREGKMTAAGLAKAPPENAGAEIPKPAGEGEDAVPAYVEEALRANGVAWTNFSRFAPSYRRLYIRWIEDAKREETRRKRLAEAVSLLERNQKLGLK